MSEYTCPKCSGTMKLGLLTGYISQTITGTIAQPVEWAEGDAEKSGFFKFFVKMKGKTSCKVETYRCANCGYLESYAVEGQ